MKIQINRCVIEIFDEPVPYVEKPMHVNEGGLDEQLGSAHKFRVTTTDDLDQIFAVVTWPAARAEVRSLEFIEGVEKYERLTGAGRWSLIPIADNRWLGELNVMKFNTKPYMTLNRPTVDELDYLAGEDFEALALTNGALAFGTRETLSGDTSRTRNAPAVIFQAGDTQAIAVCFAITRVMAVMYDLGEKND